MNARNRRTGARITRALERIQGTCGVVPDRFERTANGVLTHVYNDEGTAIDWDTAEQANDNGSAVYIDENGDRVTGDEIELYHGAAEE